MSSITVTGRTSKTLASKSQPGPYSSTEQDKDKRNEEPSVIGGRGRK